MAADSWVEGKAKVIKGTLFDFTLQKSFWDKCCLQGGHPFSLIGLGCMDLSAPEYFHRRCSICSFFIPSRGRKADICKSYFTEVVFVEWGNWGTDSLGKNYCHGYLLMLKRWYLQSFGKCMHEDNVDCSEMNVFRILWERWQIWISPGNQIHDSHAT